MAWPTWMPIVARPAHWIDWSSIFREVIPREWPKRLFAPGSQAYSDLIAFGEALALARDFASLLQHNIWPALDANYRIFMERWEGVFGLQPDGTSDQRTSRLIAVMRQRGPMTESLVKAIMCRAWNTDDPSAITIVHPDPADVAAATPTAEWEYAALQTQMHIYHTAEGAEPDYGLAADLIAKNKPTWENWYVGRYNHGKYEGSGGPEGGPGGGVGTYNHCTYS